MIAVIAVLARAAVLEVPGTYETVAGAVAAASPGDVVEVVGDHVGGLPVTIPIPLTIRGDGATTLVHDGSRETAITVLADVTFEDLAFDGDGSGQLLHVVDDAVVTLFRVELRNGAGFRGGLVLVSEGARLVATASAFTGGRAAGGGAVALEGTSRIEATDSLFEANVAADVPFPEGGAVRFEGATTGLFTRTTFVGNRNDVHIGGALSLLDGAAAVELVDCTFDGNAAAVAGAAVSLFLGNVLTVTGGVFRNGSSAGGGAIGCSGDVSCVVTCTGTTFEANASTTHGGHVYAEAGELTFTDVTFTDGHAGDAGGAISLYRPWSRLTAVDVRFLHNDAVGDGGAVWVDLAAAELVRPWACGNTAGASGGAIHARTDADLVITNGTFLANTAAEDGGAVRVWERHAAIDHGTFLGNVAGGAGSAVALEAAVGSVDLSASVLSGNAGPAPVESTVGPITLTRSAFWGHPQGDTAGDVTVIEPVVLTEDPFPGVDPASCPDVVIPELDGELVDAAGDADPDGTAGDLGATGGPDSDPDLWTDADGDGVVVQWDCDDTDGRRFPGANELPDDGIDQDCDGADVGTTLGGAVGIDCGCRSGPVRGALGALALVVLRRRITRGG